MRYYAYAPAAVVLLAVLTVPRGQDTTFVVARGQQSERHSFDCRWLPRAPSSAEVEVDLVLRRAGGAATARELHRIRTEGGVILHEFAVPVVRVALDTAAVRRLIVGEGRVAEYASTVPAGSALATDVQITYRRALRPRDFEDLADLGVEVVDTAPRPVVYGRATDGAIATLSRAPHVAEVKPYSVGCAAETLWTTPQMKLPPPPSGWDVPEGRR